MASACGNINPTYELKVNYAGSYGEGGEPKFMLTVEEGVEYTVNFKVKKDCTGGYTSKTTGTNGFEVVCKSDSISQNKINCENTVIEACDGIKVIAKYSSSIWSCPAIDTDGNLYVQTGNILTEEDSLIALTSNLSERWSIKGIDFVNFGTLPGIQPIISQTSNTIYVIYFSTLYSIANNGTINWDLGTTGLSIDGLAIGANETIYVVSGFDIYAISPTGNILWSVYLNTSFIQPTVDLDGNLYLGQDSPGLIFKFLPDSTYQSWQLPSSITDAISEFAIANDNIYVGTTEGLYALNRESGAAQLKFDTTTAIDGAGSEITTPPSFDSAGNIYFGVNNWLFSITQQGDLRWKKQTSAFITQPTIASNDVIYFINVGYPAELRAIRSDGSDILTTNINSGNYCPAYISKNGTIYITNTSEIYAIEGSSPLMNSPWPMYRHDPQNSGNAGTPLK